MKLVDLEEKISVLTDDYRWHWRDASGVAFCHAETKGITSLKNARLNYRYCERCDNVHYSMTKGW